MVLQLIVELGKTNPTLFCARLSFKTHNKNHLDIEYPSDFIRSVPFG